jgi:hypothetical protein
MPATRLSAAGRHACAPVIAKFGILYPGGKPRNQVTDGRYAFPFFDKRNVAGVFSQRTNRPFKEFAAAVDRAVGEQVRADGACGVDLWSALANVRWHRADGAMVSYSFRQAGNFVAWIWEEGDYALWYCSGPPGEVALWISEAMAAERWTWIISD